MVEVCSLAGSSNNGTRPVCASGGFLSVRERFCALVQAHSGCCALQEWYCKPHQ